MKSVLSINNAPTALFGYEKKTLADSDLGFSLLRGMRRRWSISIFSRTTEREESSVLSSLSFVPLPGHLFFRWPGYFFHQPGLFLAFFLVRSNGKVSLGTSHHSSRSSRKKRAVVQKYGFFPLPVNVMCDRPGFRIYCLRNTSFRNCFGRESNAPPVKVLRADLGF